MKDPAFLFYPNDYIGGTIGWNFEQKGAYMELLMMQFNRGHMTSDMIGHILAQSKGQNPDELWQTIRIKFIEDENGLYFNQRLEDEINKRKAYTASRRNNLGGVNQYTNNDNDPKKTTTDMVGHMTSHMENENVNEDKDINEVKKPTRSKPRARTFEDEIETLKEHYKTLWRQTSDISERDLIVSIIKLIENEHLEAVCLKPEHPTNSDVTRWVQKYTTNDVLTTVRAMENSPKSFKDKKSMRLTLNNWLARE